MGGQDINDQNEDENEGLDRELALGHVVFLQQLNQFLIEICIFLNNTIININLKEFIYRHKY